MAGIRGFRLLLVLAVFMNFKHQNRTFYIVNTVCIIQGSFGENILVNRQPYHGFQSEFVYIMGNRKCTPVCTPVPKHCHIGCLALKFLMLSGDISSNPGPIRYPCTVCQAAVRSNQQDIQCDFCDRWIHGKCTNITISEYKRLENPDDPFYCYTCEVRLPDFSDSYFESDRATCSLSQQHDHTVHSAPAPGTGNLDSSYLSLDSDFDIFDQLKEMRF